MKRGKENAESSSSCDSSSSEDEEELSRLREAALGLTTDLKGIFVAFMQEQTNIPEA